MNRHLKLFTPGPGDVDESVLEAMSTPLIRHYGANWMDIYNETLLLLRAFYQTGNDLFIIPGPASSLLDMSIGSLVPTGKKVIIGSNGFFGNRLNDIAVGYGAEVVPFTAPLGKPLDPADLQEKLQLFPDVEVVALVHHETSTTVLNPLREMAQIVRSAGKVLVVDAVASLGGVELPVDEWGIDVCVTAANKCLEAIPGIGFISISKHAWELVDKYPQISHGWYLNLATWRKYIQQWGTWHPSPVTTPANNLLAVLASMRKIMDAGINKHHAKYVRASQVIRKNMQNMGFDMFVPPAYASPIVTAVNSRPEFDLAELSSWLENKRSIAVGGALGELSGKIFRIGHLGKAAGRDYIVDFLLAIEEFLNEKEIAIPINTNLDELKSVFSDM